MKCILNDVALATFLFFLAGAAASAQDARTWEFGLGGAAVNMTRTYVSDFHQTAGGDYVFTVKEKMIHGGIEAYVARELKPWLYLDVQGTAGIAGLGEKDEEMRGLSLLAGPGIQFRPLVSSRWICPYARLGVDYYGKTFSTRYFGQFDGDPTADGMWKAEDAWNRGLTVDHDSFVPVSLGVGVIGWLGERLGIRLQGQYLTPLFGPGQNFAQISTGIVMSLGGTVRRNAVADRYVTAPPAEVREVIREVPVEKTVEVIREVVSTETIADMMDNVCFDFDKAVITVESEPVLDRVAEALLEHPEMRFLVAGYTDARGSDQYNDSLSSSRAEAVMEALIARGVPEKMLCSRGFGKRMAIVPESEPDEVRRGDRKVVIERISDENLWKYIKGQ